MSHWNVIMVIQSNLLLRMILSLADAHYAESPARLAFLEQLLKWLGRLPGVHPAAIVTHVPYANGGGVSTFTFSIEGRPPAQRGELRDAIIESTSPNYFAMMNIALRQGRLLSDTDGA